MYWVNGEYQKTAQVVDIADRGFLLGDGVFETILIRNGVGAFLGQHLARLHHSLEVLEISVPNFPDLEPIIAHLATECVIEGDGVARVTISRGASGRGLAFAPIQKSSPTMLVTVQSGVKRSAVPISVMVSSFCRPEKSISARHKTLNYLDNILARNEAMSNGVDEAIMLNGHGRLACASVANIFVIDQEGKLSTPPIAEGALPGIVRKKILEAGEQIDVAVREAPLETNILERNFIFLTNSLIGVRQAQVTGEGVSPVVPKAIETFQRLQSWYENCVSEDISRKARIS